MRLHSFRVCTDSSGKLIGLNFFMPHQHDDEISRMELGSIGVMEGDCQSLRLSSGIDRIRVSTTTFVNIKIVNNISFYSGNY